jgi:hypothetical protein
MTFDEAEAIMKEYPGIQPRRDDSGELWYYKVGGYSEYYRNVYIFLVYPYSDQHPINEKYLSYCVDRETGAITFMPDDMEQSEKDRLLGGKADHIMTWHGQMPAWLIKSREKERERMSKRLAEEESDDEPNSETIEIDRHFDNFNIAGFTYHDGVDVFDELKIGVPLSLVPEPNNSHDAYAVAIYYKDHKLGYVPKDRNKFISKFLNFGHTDLFEVKINRVSPEDHPEQQIGVVVRITDNRNAPKGVGKDE